MSNPPDQQESRRAFEAYLVERATKARRHARKNDLAATLCYLLAIVGSFAATLCAALSNLPKGAIAALTAIPGTALLANSVFAFEQKCRWHRKRKHKYDTLALRLKFEGADVAALSKELREFEQTADHDYPRFGSLGSTKSDDQKATGH
jgi:hypothetical protein